MNEAVVSYKTALADLTFNSKPLINMLTMLAEESEQMASEIVQVIDDQIDQVSTSQKLPLLYLIDSMIKNLTSTLYPQLFIQNVISIFCRVFEEVDEKTRTSMYKLRQTWTKVIPNNKLFALDVKVKRIDPAWPVTAKPPDQGSIHVNPKFLVNQPQKSQQTHVSKSATSSVPSPSGDRSVELKQKEDELERLKLELELAKTRAQLEQEKRRLEQKQHGDSVRQNVFQDTASFRSIRSTLQHPGFKNSVESSDQRSFGNLNREHSFQQSNYRLPSQAISRDPRRRIPAVAPVSDGIANRDPRRREPTMPSERDCKMSTPYCMSQSTGNTPVQLDPGNRGNENMYLSRMVPLSSYQPAAGMSGRAINNHEATAHGAFSYTKPNNENKLFGYASRLPQDQPFVQNLHISGSNMFSSSGHMVNKAATFNTSVGLSESRAFIPVSLTGMNRSSYSQQLGTSSSVNIMDTVRNSSRAGVFEKTLISGYPTACSASQFFLSSSDCASNKITLSTSQPMEEHFVAPGSVESRCKGGDDTDLPQRVLLSTGSFPQSDVAQVSNVKENVCIQESVMKDSRGITSEGLPSSDGTSSRTSMDCAETAGQGNFSSSGHRVMRNVASYLKQDSNVCNFRLKCRGRSLSPVGKHKRSNDACASSFNKRSCTIQKDGVQSRRSARSSSYDRNTRVVDRQSKVQHCEEADQSVSLNVGNRGKGGGNDSIQTTSTPVVNPDSSSGMSTKGMPHSETALCEHKSITNSDDSGKESGVGTLLSVTSSRAPSSTSPCDEIQGNVLCVKEEIQDVDERRLLKRPFVQQDDNVDQNVLKKARVEAEALPVDCNVCGAKEKAPVLEDISDIFSGEDVDYRIRSGFQGQPSRCMQQSSAQPSLSKFKDSGCSDISMESEQSAHDDTCLMHLDVKMQQGPGSETADCGLQDVDLRKRFTVGSKTKARNLASQIKPGVNPNVFPLESQQPTDKTGSETQFEKARYDQQQHDCDLRRDLFPGNAPYSVHISKMEDSDVDLRHQVTCDEMMNASPKVDFDARRSPNFDGSCHGSPRSSIPQNELNINADSRHIEYSKSHTLRPQCDDNIVGPAKMGTEPSASLPASLANYETRHGVDPIELRSSERRYTHINSQCSQSINKTESCSSSPTICKADGNIHDCRLSPLEKEFTRNSESSEDFDLRRQPRNMTPETSSEFDRSRFDGYSKINTGDNTHASGLNEIGVNTGGRLNVSTMRNCEASAEPTQMEDSRIKKEGYRLKNFETISDEQHPQPIMTNVAQIDQSQNRLANVGSMSSRMDVAHTSGGIKQAIVAPLTIPKAGKRDLVGCLLEDSRWSAMQGLLEIGAEEEIVIDGKPYEVKSGVKRLVGVRGKTVEAYVDVQERGVRINGNLVYRFGEPRKEVHIGHCKVELFYHGQPHTVWIDGQMYQIRVDAPPLSLAFDNKLFGFQIDRRDKMILVNRLEKGRFGGPARVLYLGKNRHEIAFEGPHRRILIDNQSCLLKLDQKIPFVMFNGRPHGIRFEGGPRKLFIDDVGHLINVDSASKIKIGNRFRIVALGGPAHEIIIDGKWYEVKFNNVPKQVAIGNCIHTLRLPPPIPKVKILQISQSLSDDATMPNTQNPVPLLSCKSNIPSLFDVSAQPNLETKCGLPNPSLQSSSNVLGNVEPQYIQAQLTTPSLVNDQAQARLTCPRKNILQPNALLSNNLSGQQNFLIQSSVQQANLKQSQVQQQFGLAALSNMAAIRGQVLNPNPLLLAGLAQETAGVMQMPQAAPNDLLSGAVNKALLLQNVQRLLSQQQSLAAGMNILQGDPGFQAHNIFGSALIQRPVLPGAPTMTEAACAVMKPAVSCAGLSGIAHAMSGLATGFPHNLKPSSTHTVMPSCSGPINMQSFSSGAQLSTTQTSGTKYLPNNDRENSAQSQEMPVSVPSIARADVNELLRKLLAAGIIGSKNESSSLHDTSATVHKDDGAFELTSDNSRLMTSGRVKSMKKEVVHERPPDLSDFHLPKLRQQYSAVVHDLYQGLQCASCGIRFLMEETEQYRLHLDWHFRLNRREKEASKMSCFRKWYYELKDWIMYQEIEDSGDNLQSAIFEDSGSKPESADAVFQLSVPEGVEVQHSPTASSQDIDNLCNACGDPFEQFWDEEAEGWHLRNAVRLDGKIYHPICYADTRVVVVLENKQEPALTAVAMETTVPPVPPTCESGDGAADMTVQSTVFEDTGSKPEMEDAVSQLLVPEGVEVQHSPTASSQDTDNYLDNNVTQATSHIITSHSGSAPALPTCDQPSRLCPTCIPSTTSIPACTQPTIAMTNYTHAPTLESKQDPVLTAVAMEITVLPVPPTCESDDGAANITVQSTVFENTGSKPEMADAVFQLSVPEGVEVQHSPTASCQDKDNLENEHGPALTAVAIETAVLPVPLSYESGNGAANITAKLPSYVEATTLPSNEESTTLPSNEEATTLPSNEEATTLPSNEEATTQPSNKEATTLPSNEEATALPSNDEAECIKAPDDPGSSGLLKDDSNAGATSPFGDRTMDEGDTLRTEPAASSSCT